VKIIENGIEQVGFKYDEMGCNSGDILAAEKT